MGTEFLRGSVWLRKGVEGLDEADLLRCLQTAPQQRDLHWGLPLHTFSTNFTSTYLLLLLLSVIRMLEMNRNQSQHEDLGE